MQGMKTGYHRKAGFNLVATAIRNGQRFISIVLGAKNSRSRNKYTKHLLNYGFENFKKYDMNVKGEKKTYLAKLDGGILENVSLEVANSVKILLNPTERKQLQIISKIPSKIKAPVKAKQNLGWIEYWLNGRILKKVSLQSEFAVPKKNIFYGITGLFTNLTDTN